MKFKKVASQGMKTGHRKWKLSSDVQGRAKERLRNVNIAYLWTVSENREKAFTNLYHR